MMTRDQRWIAPKEAIDAAVDFDEVKFEGLVAILEELRLDADFPEGMDTDERLRIWAIFVRIRML